jgi:hypothetical protein
MTEHKNDRFKFRRPIYTQDKKTFKRFSYFEAQRGFIAETNFEGQNYPKPDEQCTGLKDKNGKLVFDEDFLKVKNQDKEGIGHIWVDEYNCRWIAFKSEELAWNDFCCLVDYDLTFEFEVIGNSHENPELLEEINK